MIDKNAVRDVAFVAVIQHHGFSCERNTDGSYKVGASDAEFDRLGNIYRLQYKPILTRIGRLRNATAKPAQRAGVPRDGNPVSPRPKGAL